MRDRLKRIARTRKVLANLERIEEVAVADVERRIQTCLAEQQAVLDSLGRETVFDGQFIDLLSKRVGRLVREQKLLEHDRAAAEARLRSAATRSKVADGLLADAEIEAARAAEAADLEAVLELTVAALAQGRGKTGGIA